MSPIGIPLGNGPTLTDPPSPPMNGNSRRATPMSGRTGAEMYGAGISR